MNNIMKKLPPMLSGKQLEEAMTVLPVFDPTIRFENAADRLIALTDLYRVFIPNDLSREIYSKLYLALLRSLQKKESIARIRQGNENHKTYMQQTINGIIGGADSFTMIGKSGIGKSSAISRAVQLITEGRVIESDNPFTKIIPCVLVQCPFDSSVKGLLLEILRVVDEQLGSNYYVKSTSAKATTDMLIGTVSQVALNHIGILIVDEIQNVAVAKNGRNLLGALLQLINCSGISIGMVGTPECTEFFSQAYQLARRSLGLQYDSMEYGSEFYNLCQILLQYQYVRHPMEVDDAVVRWLYEHTGGNVSSVVTLLHDAQEIGIMSGKDTLGFEELEEVYSDRMRLLHTYAAPKRKSQTSKIKKGTVAMPEGSKETTETEMIPISALIQQAKSESRNIAAFLKQFIPLEVLRA